MPYLDEDPKENLKKLVRKEKGLSVVGSLLAGLGWGLMLFFRSGLITAAVIAFVVWLFELGDVKSTAITWGLSVGGVFFVIGLVGGWLEAQK